LFDCVGLDELTFVRNTNGMANGPKTAPITAQNLVLAPLLSAINQRRYAHDMHIMEMIIKPAIMLILPLADLVAILDDSCQLK
jgi:hypothetical protein